MTPPDWSLLPHRPRDFFALPETAGRQELKRAYARLVKQFKPEAHPDEFMRIRAAYEEFERALAYGLEETPRENFAPAPAVAETRPDQPPAETVEPARPAPLPQTTQTGSASVPGFPRPLSLQRPSGVSAPAAPPASSHSAFARALLAANQSGPAPEPVPESAEDFIHLAFYREARSEGAEGETAFFKTLLEGVRRFPRDRMLIETLRKFFAALDDAETIPPCLEQARWCLPGGVFFYVTEAAWFRLGEISGGKVASALLQEFMRAESGNPAQTVFLLRFLRRHFDAVDPVWFAECLDLLVDRLDGDDSTEADELRFLGAVLDFVRMPAGLREHYPVLNEIRAILELVCRGEAEAHMARIYGFYRRLANIETTCELFAGPVEHLMPAYRLIIAIRDEHLSALFRTDSTRRDEGAQTYNLSRLVADLHREAAPERASTAHESRESIEGFLLLGVTFTAFVAAYRALPDWAWWVCLPLAAPAAAFTFFGAALLHHRAFPKRSQTMQTETAWELYELHVRPHLLQYLKATRLTSGELAVSIDESNDYIRAEYQKIDPHGFIGKDMPLAFHSVGLLVMSQ